MRWIATLSVGLFVGLTVPTVAQDSSRPVIDPETVFAPGIEVVETLPVLSYDNDGRLVWYFDPQMKEWRSYSYPDELSGIDIFFSRSNGSYLLVNMGFYDGSPLNDLNVEYLWSFDPIAGIFDRPMTQCNQVEALPGEGKWVLSDDNGAVGFCNTEMGQRTNPLPDNLQVQVNCPPSFDDELFAATKWLLFHDCQDIKTLYSYEIATGQVHELGQFAPGTIWISQKWFNETTVFISMISFYAKASVPLFIVDVSKPNSLELIGYGSTFLDNPPRFVWDEVLEEPTNDGSEFDSWFEVYEYNVETGNRTRLMRYRCGTDINDCPVGPSVPNPNGQLIAIQNNPPDIVGMGLIVYDTVENRIIYDEPSQQLGNEMTWVATDTLVFISDPFNAPSLAIMQFTGNRNRKTTFSGSEIDLRFLSPDGVYYIANTENEVNLYSISTTELIPIAQFEGGNFFGYWTEDGLLGIKLSCCDYPTELHWLVRVPDESTAS